MLSNVEKTRLLIRVAGRLAGSEAEPDRGQLFVWADQLLGRESTDADGTPTTVEDGKEDNSSRPVIIFPVPIFKVYKHRRYEASLFPDWTVEMKGRKYNSPSAAAFGVTDTNSNGWRFWRYIDPNTREEQRIDHLREADRLGGTF